MKSMKFSSMSGRTGALKVSFGMRRFSCCIIWVCVSMSCRFSKIWCSL